MLERAIDMRVEAVSLAAEAKQLKREEKKALRQARYVKVNYGAQQTSARMAYLRHRNCYVERMALRHDARIHHLSRMYMDGKPYLMVEQSTHRPVDPEELARNIWTWDPAVDPEAVAIWLGQE